MKPRVNHWILLITCSLVAFAEGVLDAISGASSGPIHEIDDIAVRFIGVGLVVFGVLIFTLKSWAFRGLICFFSSSVLEVEMTCPDTSKGFIGAGLVVFSVFMFAGKSWAIRGFICFFVLAAFEIAKTSSFTLEGEGFDKLFEIFVMHVCLPVFLSLPMVFLIRLRRVFARLTPRWNQRRLPLEFMAGYVPTVVLSGLWMWKGHVIRKLF